MNFDEEEKLNNLYTSEISEYENLETKKEKIFVNKNRKKEFEHIDLPIYERECKLNLESVKTEYDFFNLIFTKEIYNFLLIQINKILTRKVKNLMIYLKTTTVATIV